VAGEVERTALGIVMALERDDPKALPALFFGDDGEPVDDLDLIVTLGNLCVLLAARIGAASDPPVDASAVLAEMALQWGEQG
jgi:hypothetical protein